ncbi:MAG: D-glycero-alpha-D-manno-heptose-7-phosphate kinase [Candidatus Berkelbacteria bacterium Licking1014_85]|uniref:D-glycero-alpha-D-manno-heptose-7-phosphate kinase n=1 Tax=Candidatus Berkelbacteria bacterium Licking1014_85 TaxID=2017148 RepID=A0A554LHW9_9BACT|nr:MAG: D-glycero-alpha-D-manno-heptose-7-phosphate kinase [Candidatus Berkelbacteria bacterium Licking1014_85]
MIITKTPFRISFFGGGTDYPAWYREKGGAVLSTTINKYCYITCRKLPPFFEHKSRIVWSLVENVKGNDEIKHPSVREALKYLGFNDGISILHEGDLPARTGLGSSSSFTVGLLNAIHALQGKMIAKMDLAKMAIHIEQNILNENVGSQDQIAAAFGGFNKIEFNGEHNFRLNPISINKEKIRHLKNHLLLFFTGISRTASDIAREQIKSIPNKTNELIAMHKMVDEAIHILNSSADICDFGKLLNDSWMLKRSLSDKISTSYIDEMYDAAMKSGALGGKLLGAGGGGFILLFVKPEYQLPVRLALKNLLEVPFDFEDSGSQIIFYNP